MKKGAYLLLNLFYLITFFFLACYSVEDEDNITVHFLKAHKSEKYTNYQPKIRNEIFKTINLFQEHFPLENIDVIVTNDPYNQLIIPHLGIGGLAYERTTVLIVIYFGNIYLDKTIESELKRILLHELNHVIRKRETLNPFSTLFRAIISEGIADQFELAVTGERPQRWSTALTEKQYEECLKLMKENPWNNKFDHSRWFFGRGDLPRWAGYSIGFRLVGDLLKGHPKVSIIDLTKMSPRDIYLKLNL